MDLDRGTTVSGTKFLEKRKWSSEFAEQTDNRSGTESRTSKRPTTATFEDDVVERKRPRLGAGSPENARPDLSKNNVLRENLMLKDLPDEILQHIFTFLHPISLGRLLCVNRRFRSLLDPTITLPRSSGQVNRLTLRSQDLVWAISRKTFLQGFLKPMDGMTELEMWRLVRGQSCQFCGKPSRGHEIPSTSAPWSGGPGTNNVRTIWPFRIRCCGRCLEDRIVKETELMITGSSVFLPGLPYAILTPALNYVPLVILDKTERPPQLQLTKYYFRPQLEELETRFHSIQDLGLPAVEEWYKGLEVSGKQKNLDAARFDQWELQSGLPQASRMAIANTTNPGSAHGNLANRTIPAGLLLDSWRQFSSPANSFTGVSPGSFSLGANSSGLQLPITQPMQMGLSPFIPASGQPPPGTTGNSMKQGAVGPALMPPPQRQRIERNKQEVEQTKLDRRKEIERRCLILQPPIILSTLRFMNAFTAAIQIPQPLDDRAWEILKPRLLGQRAEAERLEKVHNASRRNPAMQHEERRQFEEEQRVAEENESHMLLKLRVPTREKLRKYAHDFIQQAWLGGRGVTKASASKFAAEVLCHLRQRFDEVIAQEDRMLAMKGMTFPQDPDSLACRRVKLEDMKWAFEEIVKPYTDGFGKELFLCRACEANLKLFSFEGVIQHYAAKHTHDLSHGNTIVYWKANWPVDPPFDPSPNIPWVQEVGSNLIGIDGPPRSSSQALSPSRDNGLVTPGSAQRYALEVAALAVEFWRRTDGIEDLQNAVRLYIVIHHVNLRFTRTFGYELGLLLFKDVITTRDELASLRNPTGLQCSVCFEAFRGLPMMHLSRPGETFYSFLDLLTHFQRVHIAGETTTAEMGLRQHTSSPRPDSARLDWKHDMIRLPSAAAIRALQHSPGIERDKLRIIAEAFPNHFHGAVPLIDESPRFATIPQNMPMQDLGLHGTGAGSGRHSAAGAYVVHPEGGGSALEDEYDPLRVATTVPIRRPPGHARYLPPRDTVRDRPTSQYSMTSSARQQFVYSEAGPGVLWDARDPEASLSHDSMIYSYENGSSRMSYREPMTRYSETTVGATSEMSPESKATSQQSLGLAPFPAAGPATTQIDVSRRSDDDVVLSPTTQFLTNFNPRPDEVADGGSGVPGTSDTHRPRASTNFTWNSQLQHRMSDHQRSNQHSPDRRYNPTLPIREGGHAASADMQYHQHGLKHVLSRAHDLDADAAVVASHAHGVGLPETLLRGRYDEDGEMHDGIIAYTRPPYQTRYYYEEEYDRGEPRYETTRKVPSERYSYRLEEIPDGHAGVSTLGGQRYADELRWAVRNTRAEHDVQPAPRRYRAVGDEYEFGRPSEPQDHPQRDDARYAHEELYAATHRNRIVVNEDRDLVYEPANDPRRYAQR